jgi:biopolymer transport protein ExbD
MAASDRLSFIPAEAERPITVSFIPLIDIVLQIICFYLFVSAGVKAYQDSKVELPLMTARPLAGQTPAEFTINVDSAGGMDVNGSPVTMKELDGRLKEAKARAEGKHEELRVAVRADRRQHFEVLDRVLRACTDAQVSSVAIRAISEKGGGK